MVVRKNEYSRALNASFTFQPLMSSPYEFLDKLFPGKFYTAGKIEGISIASPTRTRLRQLRVVPHFGQG